MEVPCDIDVYHIDTRHHDLRSRLVMETNDVLKELLLLWFVPFKQIYRLREIIDRETIPLRLHTPSQDTRRTEQEGRQRIKESCQQAHLPRREATECQWMCLGINFRDDLTKEQ